MVMQKMPLGDLADVIAHVAAWPVEFKQHLLEELDVQRRAALVLERLRETPGGPPFGSSSPGAWPPRFSDN
jgi:hypothetical protein